MRWWAMAVRIPRRPAPGRSPARKPVSSPPGHARQRGRSSTSTPTRLQSALAEGRCLVLVAGFQGGQPGQQGCDHHWVAAARDNHGRRAWPAGAGCRRLRRSTPTWTESSRRGSADRGAPPASSTPSPSRKCSRLAACGAKVLMLRCVEYAPPATTCPCTSGRPYSEQTRHCRRRIDQGTYLWKAPC